MTPIRLGEHGFTTPEIKVDHFEFQNFKDVQYTITFSRAIFFMIFSQEELLTSLFLVVD